MFGRKDAGTVTIRGTKNSTLRKGDEIVVSADNAYWQGQVAAGNAEIVEESEVYDTVDELFDSLDADLDHEDDEEDGEE